MMDVVLGLTSLRSLLVHDTMSTFSAANRLSRLDVILSTTVFHAYGLVYISYEILKEHTGTKIFHILSWRGQKVYIVTSRARLILLLIHGGSRCCRGRKRVPRYRNGRDGRWCQCLHWTIHHYRTLQLRRD